MKTKIHNNHYTSKTSNSASSFCNARRQSVFFFVSIESSGRVLQLSVFSVIRASAHVNVVYTIDRIREDVGSAMVTTMDVATLTVDAFNKVGTTTAENEAIIVTTVVKKLFLEAANSMVFLVWKKYLPPTEHRFLFVYILRLRY